MRKIFLLFLSVSICFSFGCATTETSSGFLIGQNVSALPEGVPKKVGVPLFSGQSPINLQATDQFSAGLMNLGFEVVERQHLENVINELLLHQSGLVSEESRKKLGEHLGLEAIFVGSVTGESSIWWVDTHLNLKLVDIQTGKIVWSATANDPRLFTVSMDIKTSIIHTTKHALEMLEKDLIKLKKQKGNESSPNHQIQRMR